MLGRITVGLAALAALAWAPTADAYVYWGDLATGNIGRAANDGTGADPTFIEGPESVHGIAVDSGHLYWADEGLDSIGRANLDGSGVEPEFITGIGAPNDVAVTDDFIFWTSFFDNSVGRANIGGASPDYELVEGLDVACGVAVDAGHVYWLSQDTPLTHLGRASYGGTEKDLDFATLSGGFQCGLASDALHLYWSDLGLGYGTKIGRADITNGGSVDNSYIDGAEGPCDLTAFGERLFWANAVSNAIGTAGVDRSGIDQNYISTGGPATCSVAVDSLAPPARPPGGGGDGDADGTRPKAMIKRGPGKKLARGKAKFAFKSSEAGSFRCKLDAAKPKSCRSPKAYTGLKPGKHVFRVWAIDAAGNKSTKPATRRFRVPVA